ncbi:MAG TPA: cytochrome c-type biogenesis CcmF C-terminal domain-containing protein [Anaerolineae bacterium]|nr:cytochrome c-type biogenesis CcmF C-terminal domain-containing protein [Anaerolineae bacterium]HQJ50190.1 cytochrome c-type biogenesis CcmF C-terminal domain-containing protein [Anaerolineae bacterium]
MSALIGYLALVLALVLGVVSAAAALAAARSSRLSWLARAEDALCLATGLVVVATGSLLYLLLSRNFQSLYVYSHASTYQPTIYLISALWAGAEGSLLLWTMFIGLFAVVALLLHRRHGPDRLWPYTVATLSAVIAFFTLLLVTTQNPFFMMTATPPEGLGMSPLLENPAMIIHPPTLFLGYAAYTLPFAMAIAALAAGQSSPESRRSLRRWSLLGWLFLGTGIAIGAWWAYVELGWGGYWSWDPVENASLIPWLIGTAQLHSLLAEERQGIFRRWNLALSAATFLLCVLATLVTRGGIVTSDLHGFAETVQPIAHYLLVFLLAAVGLVSVLLYRRRNQLADEVATEHLLSRESSLFITNLLLIGLAAAILLGMMFPNLTQFIQGTKITLTVDFYDRIFAPLALVLVTLLGICPLLGWRESSPARLVERLRFPALVAILTMVALVLFKVHQPMALLAYSLLAFAVTSLFGDALRPALRRLQQRSGNPFHELLCLWSANRRSYGARMVHLAILIVAVGIAGSSLFKTESTVQLLPGQRASIHHYVVQYEGSQVVDTRNSQRNIASVSLYRGQSPIAVLRPEKNLHYSIAQYISEVAIRSTLIDDVYIALEWPEHGGIATLRLAVYPLVSWLWLGAGLLLVGTLLALWPGSAARHEAQDEPAIP